jgi:GTP-binding protein HflX
LKYKKRTNPLPEPGEGDGHLLIRPQRIIVVGVVVPGLERDLVEEHLDELERLARSAGAKVVGRSIQERKKIDPAFFIGKGKAEEVSAEARAHRADVVIFDDDLTPSQAKNLSGIIEAQVVDRSGLILDIFGRRARSREAKTQVELARLNYLLPRLRGGWTHLSRQEGGIGVRGGIGETQIELDRRAIRHQIHKLTEQLKQIESERRRRRETRKDALKIAMVGYTNAGKTTLFNALTQNDAEVADRLFTTLDSLVRRVKLKAGKDVLLVDTVGFIRKLPHHLVASFRSTLEEATEADILLHVVDVSHPEFEEQIRTTDEVLNSLEMEDRPSILVFNKEDQLADPDIADRASRTHPDAVFVSAKEEKGLDSIFMRIERILESDIIEVDVCLSSSDKESISRIYAMADVIKAIYHDGVVDLKFRTSRVRARILRARLQTREAG